MNRKTRSLNHTILFQIYLLSSIHVVANGASASQLAYTSVYNVKSCDPRAPFCTFTLGFSYPAHTLGLLCDSTAHTDRSMKPQLSVKASSMPLEAW